MGRRVQHHVDPAERRQMLPLAGVADELDTLRRYAAAAQYLLHPPPHAGVVVFPRLQQQPGIRRLAQDVGP